MIAILHDILFEIKHMDRSKASIRRFGFVLTGILVLISGYLLYKASTYWPWLLGAGGLSALLSAFLPLVFRHLYVGLTVLSIVVGYFVSKVILVAMFILFFVPVGLLARLFRLDLLDQRIQRTASTYWIKKDPRTRNREEYERLF
jgi:hypothetical protein